jgi:hypothetical protein
MDGVGSAGNAAQVLGQILQAGAAAETGQAEKLMKMSVELAVTQGKEMGKGELFDAVA